MSFLTAITVLSPMVAEGLGLAHTILKRNTPEMAEKLEDNTLEKIELEAKINKMLLKNPSETNCVELEDLFAKIKELDEKIVMYQKFARKEHDRITAK
jgi:hypothetical protein